MNSHNNQTQELIKEIDALLESDLWHSASAWKKNAQKSQKLLKRVKNFLASQSQPDLDTGIPRESERPVREQERNQMAQVLARLVEPWQEEIENLQAYRIELHSEIRELERQRQYNYSLAQQYSKQQQIISEFSQALLAPVQDKIIDYLESIINFQQQQVSSTVQSQVSKEDEQLFPARRVEERGQWQEEIKAPEDTFAVSRRQEQSQYNPPQNLEKLQSRIEGPQVQGEGEIFPYPGYEWFDSGASREEEVEETKQEALGDRSFVPQDEDREESFLLSSGKLEEVEVEVALEELNGTLLQLEEEEEVEEENLSGTFLQLEEEEKVEEEDLSGTLLQLEEEEEVEEREADFGLETVGEKDGETVVSREVENNETQIQLEETEGENIEELSELFGELSQKEEEEREGKISLNKGETPTKEAKKKTAIATLDKEPFVAASADENLLPTKEPIEEKDLELLVNENTIEQLATDLAQLEEANLEEEGNYLEGYEWENTVLQTDGENAELEPSFPPEFIPPVEEEESEEPFVLEGSSEEAEDVASFEDLLSNISDFSKQVNSIDRKEEERIDMEASEERTLEDILASLTSEDEEITADDGDDYEEKILTELLELDTPIQGEKL